MCTQLSNADNFAHPFMKKRENSHLLHLRSFRLRSVSTLSLLSGKLICFSPGGSLAGVDALRTILRLAEDAVVVAEVVAAAAAAVVVSIERQLEDVFADRPESAWERRRR